MSHGCCVFLAPLRGVGVCFQLWSKKQPPHQNPHPNNKQNHSKPTAELLLSLCLSSSSQPLGGFQVRLPQCWLVIECHNLDVKLKSFGASTSSLQSGWERRKSSNDSLNMLTLISLAECHQPAPQLMLCFWFCLKSLQWFKWPHICRGSPVAMRHLLEVTPTLEYSSDSEQKHSALSRTEFQNFNHHSAEMFKALKASQRHFICI